MELIAPGIWRIRLGEPEPHTPVALRAEPIALEALAAMAPAEAAPLNGGVIRFRTSARDCTIELPLRTDEAIFGFGLQLKSHNQTTLKKTLRVNSDPVADTGDSHAPCPFYLSTAGYGVYVDTARYAAYYCGSHAGRDATAPDKDTTGVDNTESLYRRDRTPRGPMVVDIPAARGVDVYLFAGPSMLEALRRYVLFSGGGCLPPLWGLGVWYRGYTGHTQDEALATARRLRDQRIPCDVYGLEPGWQSHTYSCSYRWSEARFPRPEAFLDDLAALNLRPNLWEHVFVHPSAEFHEAMRPHAGSLQVWFGLVPDLTRDEPRRLLADYHEEHFVRRGISGFKLDECDNSDFIVYPWSFPEHTQFPSGVDGEQMHCLLGLLYQQIVLDIFRRNDRRTFCQVRSSGALAGPYPFALYSDLYDHRDFLRGVVNAPLCGMLWSPEVRQCAGTIDLVRRVQSVALSAQALVNAWMIRNPPWVQVNRDLNNGGEEMADAPEATRLVREAFALRMRLLPVLYSAFARYREDGTPPIRPLVLDWPHDRTVHGVDDAWMFGTDLLVAPVVAGQTQREVYLPEGQWFDFWSRASLDGGRWHSVDAPLDRIPLFVRAGTILPLAEAVEFVTPETVFQLDVLVFGQPARPTVLWEDDGETYAFARGECNRLELSWEAGQGMVRRTGNYPAHRYAIRRWETVDGPA